MANQTNYTFWELISQYRIEIPIIQRDYAQGRKNSKTDDVRENFVKDIKETLISDSQTLHLNFVYGKLNGIESETKIRANQAALTSMIEAVRLFSSNLNLNVNIECKLPTDTQHPEKSLSDVSFIPLDGQQRLTTLFLLHWYILNRSKIHLPNSPLANFLYRIRPGSKSFCQALINPQNNFDIKPETKSISELIFNVVWFHNYWKNDPTVMGMITMLDEIHTHFKDEKDLVMIWNNLTEQRKISFEFLDLREYNMTNELYVKMNGRGLSLTPFENFKSWLMEYIQDKHFNIDCDIVNWKSKFDKEWTDLFWKYKDEKNFLIDEEFMRFIRNMFQIYYVKSGVELIKNPTQNEEKELIELNRSNLTKLATTKDKTSEEYIYVPNTFYQRIGILTESNIKDLFKLLDVLSSNLPLYLSKIDDIQCFGCKESGNLFEDFISGEMSYSTKVKFYAFVKYITNCLDPEFLSSDSSEFYFRWMRIMRNMIENTTIDSPQTFASAILSIDNLWDFLKNSSIYNCLAKISDPNIILFFNRSQIAQEITKAKLIIDNPDFEMLFLKYENCSVFRGNIEFALPMAENENGYDKLTNYFDIVVDLINPDFPYGYPLIRAILAKSATCGNIQLLNRRDSWLTLLKREDYRNGFWSLVESIYTISTRNKDSVFSLIESVIDEYEDKSILWRYFIIKYGELLDSDASRSKIIKEYFGEVYLYNNEGGNWINNDNQFLISNYRNQLITLYLKEIKTASLNNTGDWWIKKTNSGKIFYRGHVIHGIIPTSIVDPICHISFSFQKKNLLVGYKNDLPKVIRDLPNPESLIQGWSYVKSFDYPQNETDFDSWISGVSDTIEDLRTFILLK